MKKVVTVTLIKPVNKIRNFQKPNFRKEKHFTPFPYAIQSNIKLMIIRGSWTNMKENKQFLHCII